MYLHDMQPTVVHREGRTLAGGCVARLLSWATARRSRGEAPRGLLCRLLSRYVLCRQLVL
jgi:hypothetical protein